MSHEDAPKIGLERTILNDIKSIPSTFGEAFMEGVKFSIPVYGHIRTYKKLKREDSVVKLYSLIGLTAYQGMLYAMPVADFVKRNIF